MLRKIASIITFAAIAASLALPSTSLAGEGGGEGGEGLRLERPDKKGAKRLRTVPRKTGRPVAGKKVKTFTTRIKTRDGRRTWFKLKYRSGKSKGTLVQYAKSRRSGRWAPYRVSEVKLSEITKGSRYNSKTKTTTIKVKDFGGKTRTFTIKGKLSK